MEDFPGRAASWADRGGLVCTVCTVLMGEAEQRSQNNSPGAVAVVTKPGDALVHVQRRQLGAQPMGGLRTLRWSEWPSRPGSWANSSRCPECLESGQSRILGCQARSRQPSSQPAAASVYCSSVLLLQGSCTEPLGGEVIRTPNNAAHANRSDEVAAAHGRIESEMAHQSRSFDVQAQRGKDWQGERLTGFPCCRA